LGYARKTKIARVDAPCVDAFIADSTWKALVKRYSTHQLIDLIFTVGLYNMVSMALNTLDVQLEDGVKGFPK
jgi:4-carboxymuconolactone decarboxylase